MALAILFLFGRPAFAQIRYPEFTFKDSLVQTLFQYGREVYYRGIDPQEAAFVFQRILILDCRHGGAQEFLGKIKDKYPDVSIRIIGCSQDQEITESVTSDTLDMPEEAEESSLRHERRLAGSRTDIPEAAGSQRAISSERTPSSQKLDIRATPLRAFSEPIGIEALTPQEQLEATGPIDNFPIIEPSLSSEPKLGFKDENYGISKDCEKLRTLNGQLGMEISQLKQQIQLKDDAILRYQKEIASIHGTGGDPSYALISQDQRDLIRVQQENIDYLEKELAEARAQTFGNRFEADPAYNDMRRQIAGAQLAAKENEMNLEVKYREAQLLQKQLVELQEQLRLVKKILSEKNDIIKSLQDDLETLKIESD